MRHPLQRLSVCTCTCRLLKVNVHATGAYVPHVLALRLKHSTRASASEFCRQIQQASMGSNRTRVLPGGAHAVLRPHVRMDRTGPLQVMPRHATELLPCLHADCAPTQA